MVKRRKAVPSDNPHNVKNQEASLQKCRAIFRHDELIEIFEELCEARLAGVEVTEILRRLEEVDDGR